jgi:hypothetical protein
MWSLLKTLLVQGILARTALRSFGWLVWLLPLGFLFKWIGLPLLAILGTLSIPVLILLAVIGLPIIVVIVFGGILMSIVGFVLTAGIAVLKVMIPVLLVFWVARWALRSRSKDPSAPATPATPAATVNPS